MANAKNFKSLDALQPVVNVVNEAGEAIKDTNRTVANSAITDVLAGALGAGIGGVVSFIPSNDGGFSFRTSCSYVVISSSFLK